MIVKGRGSRGLAGEGAGVWASARHHHEFPVESRADIETPQSAFKFPGLPWYRRAIVGEDRIPALAWWAVCLVCVRVDLDSDIAAQLHGAGQVVGVWGPADVPDEQYAAEPCVGQRSPGEVRRHAVGAVEDELLVVERAWSAVSVPFGLGVET